MSNNKNTKRVGPPPGKGMNPGEKPKDFAGISSLNSVSALFPTTSSGPIAATTAPTFTIVSFHSGDRF